MSFIMPGFWYTLRVLLHQVFTVQSLKSWVWLWLFRGKTGTNVQFIHWLCALTVCTSVAQCICSITISHQPLWFWRFYVTFFNQHKEKCIDGNTLGIFLKLFKTLTAHVLSLHWKLLWADTLGRVKKVSMSGAGYLQEYKNSEFVWELRKKGFSEGCCK